MNYSFQLEYSDEISRLRFVNDIDAAISLCKEAIDRFPDSYFFHKILGDMYYQASNFEDAGNAYLSYIRLIGEKPEQFTKFARFYHKLKGKAPSNYLYDYHKQIDFSIKMGEIPETILKNLETLVQPELRIDTEFLESIKSLCDDRLLQEFRRVINGISDPEKIRMLINWRACSNDKVKCSAVDSYLVSIAERFELYIEAIELIKKIHTGEFRLNPTIVRTLLRICRKLEDYSYAEDILDIDVQLIGNSDFNIQYELVYYFQYKKDDEMLNRTLKVMRSSARASIPIARTLYNFYLNNNKFEEAREIADHIRRLQQSKTTHQRDDKIDEQLESEFEIWNKLRGLISEQEHNRQMIAMRELLKGFSHELGQPITNIRYSTQLYQLKVQKGIMADANLNELIDIILSQTARIGKLLNRFQPMVSSKSKSNYFCVCARIMSVFLDLAMRLEKQNIEYKVCGNDNIQIWGDPVQFDQVFYNLILNSMQAIESKNQNGQIVVTVTQMKQGRIQITFTDNGPGIPEKNAKKIFEPFYSTKNPTSQLDGGEGLGLFIVWNVLKMFSGTINLDTQNKIGARFVILISQKEENNYVSSVNN